MKLKSEPKSKSESELKKKSEPKPKSNFLTSERFFKIRKWLIGIAISWILVGGGLFLSLKYLAAPWLKNEIETRGSVVIHGELRVGYVSFALFPSFGIRLHDVKLKSDPGNFVGQITELSAYLDTQLLSLLQGGAMLRIRVKAAHPVVTTQEKAPQPIGDSAQAKGQPRSLAVPEIHSPRPFALVLDVSDGEFTRLPFDVALGPNTWKGFEFSVHVPDITHYKAQVEFASRVRWEKNGIVVPMDLQISSGVELLETTLFMPDLQGTVNGIPSKGSLSYDLLDGPSDVKLSGSITEIGDLKTLPVFLPAGQWKGQSDYAFHLSRDNDLSEWLGAGTLQIHALNGTTEFAWPADDPQLKVNGLVSSDVQLDFTLDRSPNNRKPGPLTGDPLNNALFANSPLALSALNRLRIDHLKFWLDLSQSQVSYVERFQKPKSIPFSIELEGGGTSDQIHVTNAKFQFAALKANGSGDWLVQNPKSSVDVLGWKLKVEPTDLNDWDKYFTIFEGSPVKGRIQLDSSFSGDLRHLDQLSLAFHPLLLQKVEGNVHWRSRDAQQSVTGPIRIDGKLDLESKGKDFKLNEAKLDLDLTQLDLFAKDTINKKAGVPLTLSLEGAEDKGQIEIPKMILQVHSSQFFMACRLAQPRKPVFALNMIANKLNLGELAEILTPLSETGLSGVASGHFTLQGTYDYQEGLKQSPLRFSSDIHAEIPSLKIPNNWALTKLESKTTPHGVTATRGPKPTPERPAYLDWPVFKTAEMKFELLIGKLSVNRLEFEGLRTTASLISGKLAAEGAVRQFFGGDLNSAKITSNLLDTVAGSDLQADVRGINLQKLSHTLPDGWMDSLRGILQGHVAFRFPPLQSHSFSREVRGFGNFEALQFVLSQQPLTPLAEKLAPAKQGTTAPAPNSNVTNSTLQASFQVLNGAISFKPLKWSEGESRFEFQGPLAFDQSLNLVGTAEIPMASSPLPQPAGRTAQQAESQLGPCMAPVLGGDRGNMKTRCRLPVILGGSVAHPTLSLSRAAH